MIFYLMVKLANGVARERACKTMTSRNRAAIDMPPWLPALIFDIGDPCYGQLTPVKSKVSAD